jgi:hypothetical protein
MGKGTCFTSERTVWNNFRGNGRRCAIRRRRLNKDRAEYFNGSGIDAFMDYLSYHLGNEGEFNPKTSIGELSQIDLDGLRFIIRWGREFKPYVWGSPPASEPVSKQCFSNAWGIMDGFGKLKRKHPAHRNSKITMLYAEGIAAGPIVRPMLHGWNVRQKEWKAFDWTFYAGSKWVYYWGIAFTPEEYARLAKVYGGPRHKGPASFFFKDHFSIRLKVEMQKIFKERRLVGKKVPKKK